jgi:hypothetical protein
MLSFNNCMVRMPAYGIQVGRLLLNQIHADKKMNP